MADNRESKVKSIELTPLQIQTLIRALHQATRDQMALVDAYTTDDAYREEYPEFRRVRREARALIERYKRLQVRLREMLEETTPVEKEAKSDHVPT